MKSLIIIVIICWHDKAGVNVLVPDRGQGWDIPRSYQEFCMALTPQSVGGFLRFSTLGGTMGFTTSEGVLPGGCNEKILLYGGGEVWGEGADTVIIIFSQWYNRH